MGVISKGLGTPRSKPQSKDSRVSSLFGRSSKQGQGSEEKKSQLLKMSSQVNGGDWMNTEDPMGKSWEMLGGLSHLRAKYVDVIYTDSPHPHLRAANGLSCIWLNSFWRNPSAKKFSYWYLEVHESTSCGRTWEVREGQGWLWDKSSWKQPHKCIICRECISVGISHAS